MSNLYSFDDQNQFDDVQYESYDDTQHQAQHQPVLQEAVKRIQQAKLYETLLNHNLFAPGSADAEIQDRVESEIRSFILERLETLLGMRQEKAAQSHKVINQFDEEEVEALKALASRALRRPAQTQPSNPVLNQVVSVTHEQPTIQTPQIKQVTVNHPQTNQPKPQPKQPQQRRKRSASVSETGRDYSQAISQVSRPAPMPSNDAMNQINLQSATKRQVGLNTGGNSELASLLSTAVRVSQDNAAKDPNAE